MHTRRIWARAFRVPQSQLIWTISRCTVRLGDTCAGQTLDLKCCTVFIYMISEVHCSKICPQILTHTHVQVSTSLQYLMRIHTCLLGRYLRTRLLLFVQKSGRCCIISVVFFLSGLCCCWPWGSKPSISFSAFSFTGYRV